MARSPEEGRCSGFDSHEVKGAGASTGFDSRTAFHKSLRPNNDEHASSAIRYALSTIVAVAALLPALAISGCSKSTEPVPDSRTYRMGFSHFSPRLTIPEIVATLDKWQSRGDAGIMLVTPPWASLLADTAASVVIRREYLQIVERYRSAGFEVVVMLDATDGFDRRREAAELVSLGRSIGEPAIQTLYRDFVMAIDSILKPDYLGLAMETNLVRAVAAPSLYSSLRAMANAAAVSLRAGGTTAKLFASVQVETAWGKMPGMSGYTGIAQDLADFPFMDALGLSSYPNLTTVAAPEDLPLDYYSRLVPDGSLPMLVVEGGWTSADGTSPSSPDLQARYIDRHMAIADRAKLVGIFQLTFTDIDVASYGAPGAQLIPFASLGLVTVDLQDKPALARWDRAFSRRLTPP